MEMDLCLLTCTRWPHQHSNRLHEQDQANGTGEPLSTNYCHENLKLQCTHHAVGDAKEDAEDHQRCVAISLGTNVKCTLKGLF